MPGFLYFLPSERTYQPIHLVEYGLQHIVDSGVGILQQQVIRGPGCQPGVLIGAEDRWTQGDVKWSDHLRHKPLPKPHAAKQAMCCWLDGKIPAPADLVRVKQLSGQYLTLADGRPWLVPHARRWSGGQYLIELPRAVDIDDDGQFVMGDVLPQYAAIWEHACNYWDQLTESARKVQAGESGDFTINNPMQIIVDALAANYRVSARELGIMRAIDDQIVNDVLRVLIDYDGMSQLEKKTEGDIGTG